MTSNIILGLAFKKATPDASNAGIDGLLAWVVTHLTTIDEALRVVLTVILVLSAFIRLAIGAVKFYRTIKDKGVNGD